MRAEPTSDAERPRRTPNVLHVAAGAVLACAVAFIVWFIGFDVLWSIAAAVAVLAVSAAIATSSPDEYTVWLPPPRRTPRGTRLAVSTLEQSLAACDRLARPSAVRQLRALLFPEREDRASRLHVLRQLRALLVTELHDRGIDPTTSLDEAVQLLGPDASAVLQPHNDTPITASTVARCLDAVERNATPTPGFP